MFKSGTSQQNKENFLVIFRRPCLFSLRPCCCLSLKLVASPTEVTVILRFSYYPCSVTGHRVPDPNPRLPESLSGFEMGEVIEAKPLIAISL